MILPSHKKTNELSYEDNRVTKWVDGYIVAEFDFTDEQWTEMYYEDEELQKAIYQEMLEFYNYYCKE